MTEIVIAVTCLGVIGIVLSVILFLTSRKFAVYTDPRIPQIAEVLPKANCGGCGFLGCTGFAEACVQDGSLEKKHCPVGGKEVMENIAGILGIGASVSEPQIAVVRCQGSRTVCPSRNRYDGIRTCRSMSLLYGGTTGCSWGCLGCGDCVSICAFGALHIDPESGLPVISEQRCTGCGLCAGSCPRNIIQIRPKGKLSRRIYVGCVNQDKGAVCRKACAVSCIGCGKCVKACAFEALTLKNNRAEINPEKCRLCRKCVEVCPSQAIVAVNFPLRKKPAASMELKET